MKLLVIHITSLSFSCPYPILFEVIFYSHNINLNNKTLFLHVEHSRSGSLNPYDYRVLRDNE